MMWQAPELWRDERCFIIGGGNSITKQFNIPDEIVQKVFTKEEPISIYSTYMSKIHNEHVIGVNVAGDLGSWVDVLFYGDDSFPNKHLEGLYAFPNLIVTSSANPKKELRVKQMKKAYVRGLSLQNDVLNWNYNSGASAINLAVHFGVKQIILLGFDMNVDANGNQHFHKEYGKQIKKTIQGVFNKHLEGFPTIAKHAKKLGVEIINCNPQSAIECFPKMNLNEIL